MKRSVLIYAVCIAFGIQNTQGQIADVDHYLDSLKVEFQKEWPQNRTINIVFHGHSVPAGYFKTPVVNTLAAYPHLVRLDLMMRY
jgi:hypothetical protein